MRTSYKAGDRVTVKRLGTGEVAHIECFKDSLSPAELLEEYDFDREGQEAHCARVGVRIDNEGHSSRYKDGVSYHAPWELLPE